MTLVILCFLFTQFVNLLSDSWDEPQEESP